MCKRYTSLSDSMSIYNHPQISAFVEISLIIAQLVERCLTIGDVQGPYQEHCILRYNVLYRYITILVSSTITILILLLLCKVDVGQSLVTYSTTFCILNIKYITMTRSVNSILTPSFSLILKRLI